MATRRRASSREEPRYSPHPGLGAASKLAERLEATTGKGFEAWIAIARRARIPEAGALQAWLRDRHGLASRIAWWIASTAHGEGAVDYDAPDVLVDALYSGRRATLRPLHEELVDALLALGNDVIVTACKGFVPAYRKFIFAALRPVPTGVEVELALGDAETGLRLKQARARAGDDRLTRAVVVGDAEQIDAELREWLATAYDAGARRAERSTEFVVPPELARAIARSKPARTTWAACTPAMQRDMVLWITGAKQDATRQKRLATALAKLAAGERRVY